MRGWCHIILVGASVLVNAYRKGVIRLDLPRLEESLRNEQINMEEMVADVLKFVSTDCRKASAELNTCMDLIIEGHNRGLQQWVYLLFSDTKVGELCVKILKRFLDDFSRNNLDHMLSIPGVVKIEHLGDPNMFGDGLANLFTKIIKIVSAHKAQGDKVFIHASGGFKPETAIAVLAANTPMGGVPVFYVHEHFNRVVRIPAIPVDFRQWRKFSEMMNDLLIFNEVNRKFFEEKFGRDAVEEAVRLGWIREKGVYLSLTEMGKILWRYLRRIKR